MGISDILLEESDVSCRFVDAKTCTSEHWSVVRMARYDGLDNCLPTTSGGDDKYCEFGI